jgi:DNA-binding NtrC family response regulator
MAKVLIIEDDAALRECLAETLSDLGFCPIVAVSGRQGLDIAGQERIDAVLLDLRMPGMDGLDVLRRLRADPRAAPPVAILTAYANSANTIEAMRLGAFDHLTKPIGRDDLLRLISRMLRTCGARDRETAPPASGDDEIIGSSAATREVEKQIGLVADSDATVLITGETGTGKELVARAIHRFGRRGSGPFIAVNCAAIPADLLESELFGHMRGAFTGALAERRGAFREADKGTLFLDEIGDMDFALQAKILRALQERVVTPVGGRAVKVDVRVLAATNKDLIASAQVGRFREDLFFRLNVLPIHLRPLRERPDDIMPLAEHFVRRATTPPKRFGSGVGARLSAYPWPGNIRELRNAIERAAILSRGAFISASEFDFLTVQPGLHAPTPDFAKGDLPTAVARLERYMILRTLEETDGNRSEAVRRLGIHRQLLYAKAEKFGIDAGEPSEIRSQDVATDDKAR